jgi:hypothetical protein
MTGTRKIIDCRNFPSETPCSIAISGSEEDVLELAVLHASSVHGHKDTPESASSFARCSRTRAQAALQPKAAGATQARAINQKEGCAHFHRPKFSAGKRARTPATPPEKSRSASRTAPRRRHCYDSHGGYELKSRRLFPEDDV